jgi:polyisoprenyl-phosphate glycosyltransferase
VRNKTFASVVLYTRNEPAAVSGFVERIGPWLAENFELHEVIVVDDASTADALAPIAETAARYDVNVVAIQLARRHGVEAGIKAGLDRALGDWVFEFETASIDFAPEILAEMYRLASQGCDIVSASGDDGSLRSRIFYRFVNHYAELDVPLRTERIRLVSRRALNAMLAMRDKVRYRKALYAVLGYRHHHLRYLRTAVGPPRRSGRSDRETWSLAFDILLSFSGFGLRLAHRLSFAFGLLSVGAACYAVVIFLFKNNVVQGWTTVTVLISGGFTGLFLVVGILGEYLARILVEVRGRPLYSIRDTVVYTPTGNGEADLEPTPGFLVDELGEPDSSSLHAATPGARS